MFVHSGSFVLSLADVDPHLMMEDESLVWTSKDVVIVLQHEGEKIPLRFVMLFMLFMLLSLSLLSIFDNM